MVKLKWITPDADAMLGYIARVSNPGNQGNPEVAKLLRYCAANGHWSVFEHACACVEINTTRDIARQILRHRSFSFSEFSQRYADATQLGDFVTRECRLQDTKNRQNSLKCEDTLMSDTWKLVQEQVAQDAKRAYEWALSQGIAKEQARALLPEGLTPSRLYMTGTMRLWITYLQVRLDPATQREHREVAARVLEALYPAAPITMGAFFEEQA